MKFETWWQKFGLSGLAVALLAVRVAVAWPKAGWPEVIGLFLCLCVHYGKSYLGDHQNVDRDSLMREISQLQSDFSILESKVSGINLNLGIKSSAADEG